MKSEKTLDDTACMDSMFSMSRPVARGGSGGSIEPPF